QHVVEPGHRRRPHPDRVRGGQGRHHPAHAERRHPVRPAGHPLQRGVAGSDPHARPRTGVPARDHREHRQAQPRPTHRRARGPGQHRAVPRVRRVGVHHRARDQGRRRPARAPAALRVQHRHRHDHHLHGGLRFVSEQEPTGRDELSFNPFDPNETQHMWSLMERLRSECPVSRPMEGFVYTATYADTAATFKDARRFSSAEGFRGAGVVVPEEESFLGEIDPPLHPRVRRLLHRAFTPRTAAEVEPFTRRLTDRLLDAIEQQGGGDLMAGLCTRLPVAVSAEALGIPEERHDEVARWCQELLHSTWPETNATERGVGIGGAFPELASIIDEQIRRRREAADPPDDLLTRMVQAEDGGDRLTDLHIRTLSVNTLAGSLSTTYMLGNLLYRLVSDAGFDGAIRGDRSLIPEAVEESLRLEPPVLFLFRTAKEDTEIGGTPVHRGE